MGWDAPWHWVVLAILVIALFGYKKLPDASRAVGRSLRIFKSEIKGLSEDDQKRAEERPATTPELPAAPTQPPTAGELTPQMTPQATPPAAPPPSGASSA
jgi:sec-independent protein translocase protein TatA